MVTRWHAPDVEAAIHTAGLPCFNRACRRPHVLLETHGRSERQVWECEHRKVAHVLHELTPLQPCTIGGHHGEPDTPATCPHDAACRPRRTQ